MPDAPDFDDLIVLYRSKRHELAVFMEGVAKYIGGHPDLLTPGFEIIHSWKSRLKNEEHLREKIRRKLAEGKDISADNFFSKVTDLAGVRVLHLFQSDFRYIDKVVRQREHDGDWVLAQRPKAYTWDPETVEFFGQFELEVSEKPTSYTSVHYLLRPRADSPLCCELQVRTLFEEIWGEVDHRINYPTPTDNIACREQIKVLSKIVGAGSRLLDSIERVHGSKRERVV